MRNALAAVAVVAFVGLAAQGADEKYASKEGKYKVQFPAGTKVKTETKKAGEFDMPVATVTDGSENKFAVMFVDLPAAVKADPKALLDGIEGGMVKTSGGKLESSKEITFGGAKLPGREVIVDKDGGKVKTRILLADTRVYIIIAGGPKAFGTSAEATKFLDSFEITK